MKVEICCEQMARNFQEGAVAIKVNYTSLEHKPKVKVCLAQHWEPLTFCPWCGERINCTIGSERKQKPLLREGLTRDNIKPPPTTDRPNITPKPQAPIR